MIGALGTALIRLGASIGLDLAWELTEASTAAVQVIKRRMAEWGGYGHGTFNEWDGLAWMHLSDTTVTALWHEIASGRPHIWAIEEGIERMAAEYIIRRLGLTHEEILVSIGYGTGVYPLPDSGLLLTTAWRLRRMIEQTDDAPLILALQFWSDTLRDLYQTWYTDRCPSSMPLGWW